MLERMNRPLTRLESLLGWLTSSVLFFAIAGILGGPTEGDAAESVYATWAVAHGRLACFYPPAPKHQLVSIADPFAVTAPFYPLVTGLISWILRLGHSFAFPSTTQLGPNCVNGYKVMLAWSADSNVILPTVRLGYLVWPVLLVGVVLVLRASGRGRSRWEFLATVLTACAAPVVMCLVAFFHPQDVLAMGFVLIGVALAMKKKWFWAGILLGLAFTTQQFALLVAAPLFMIAPSRDRLRLVAGALVTAAIIDLPLIIATSGRATKFVLLGSSKVGGDFRSFGGSVLWETNLQGAPLLLVSRILPIAATMLLAWWASRRLGSRTFEPLPLLSLLSLCLALRLVFEENLFGYYFMAVAVMMILLDVVGQRIRGYTIAWLGLVTLAFNPVHWGLFSNWTPWDHQLYEALPTAFMGIATAAILYDALHHRVRIYKVLWLAIVAVTCESQLWGRTFVLVNVPHWLWQIFFVTSAIALLYAPLGRELRRADSEDSTVESLAN